MPERGERPWNHKLMGCCDNPLVCIVTTWLPCYTFGMNRLMLSGMGCCLWAWGYGIPILGPILHWQQRKEIRRKLRIGGGGDCIRVCCCPLCALCQESNELRDALHEEAEKELEELQKRPQEVTLVVVQQPGGAPPPQTVVVQPQQQPLPPGTVIYTQPTGGASAAPQPQGNVVYTQPTAGAPGAYPPPTGGAPGAYPPPTGGAPSAYPPPAAATTSAQGTTPPPAGFKYTSEPQPPPPYTA